jgi:hypothetical protein
VYAGFGGCPFPPGSRDQCGVGQLEHAHPRGLVCDLSAGGSLSYFAEAGFPLYAQAWQLAQYGGNRVRGSIEVWQRFVGEWATSSEVFIFTM